MVSESLRLKKSCFVLEKFKIFRPTDAYNFIEKYGAVECDYAYKNAEEVCQFTLTSSNFKFHQNFISKTCKRRKFNKVIENKEITVVEEQLNGDEELLKRIVAAKGSVSVVMHISESIYTYAKGVYLDDKCPSKASDVNHAVVICGYGEDP
jgi:C1A family cysteine protease